MEELVENHTRINSQYQGDRKVGLAVVNGAPGTMWNRARTPASFTSRTPCAMALVAAINLNIIQQPL